MANWEERILRIFRHGSREFIDFGEVHSSADGSYSAWAGAGVGPDGEAHISPESKIKIKRRAQSLELPEGFNPKTDTVFFTSSDKIRCVETMLGVLIGMNNKQLVAGGVPEEKINSVHAMAPAVKEKAAPYRLIFRGDKKGHSALGEPVFHAYVDGQLVEDLEGNQLFVESMMQVNKERFPQGSFRYQATVAMDPEDGRIQETPKQVATRGLVYLVPKLAGTQIRVVQGATHTFGIEALFNEMCGVPMGNNGNDLYSNAGGGFDEGGFFEVRVMFNTKNGKFDNKMQVARTMNFESKGQEEYDGTKLLQPQDISTETLMKYM